jgi:hypothetical protein
MDLFFNEEGKRAADERKKRFLSRFLHKTKKEKREMRRSEKTLKCSSSAELFFNKKNDEHEFQDEQQVLQFLLRPSFWVVRTITTKTRFY